MPVCYNHASMMICKKIISTITAAAAAVALFTVSVPVALAGSDNASRKAITSSRSFPKMNTARKDLLKETVSVSSDDSESWGGVESLNVPETKSTAEKKAEEEAKKAEEERRPPRRPPPKPATKLLPQPTPVPPTSPLTRARPSDQAHTRYAGIRVDPAFQQGRPYSDACESRTSRLYKSARPR